MERWINILPLLISLECALASIPLLMCRKWGSAIYWVGAALVNFSAAILIRRFG